MLHSYAATNFQSFLDRLEVDLVVELANGRLLAIEIKSSATVSEKAWSNLTRFKRRFPDGTSQGFVCMSAVTRNCPETATKLPAGGHENCPVTVMGSARHDVVCLAAVRG